MGCNHRFMKELIPTWEIKYLFIGTFNPVWNNNNVDNGDYFYGRSKNQFWCILPNVFNSPCLIYNNKDEKIKFCISHKIGVTDIIRSIPNADETNKYHRNLILYGYNDNNLESKFNDISTFDIEFNTRAIINLIETNPIKGVFFTRSTFSKIPRVKKQWNKIKNCSKNQFRTGELLSPAQYFTYGVKDKIKNWTGSH